MWRSVLSRKKVFRQVERQGEDPHETGREPLHGPVVLGPRRAQPRGPLGPEVRRERRVGLRPPVVGLVRHVDRADREELLEIGAGGVAPAIGEVLGAEREVAAALLGPRPRHPLLLAGRQVEERARGGQHAIRQRAGDPVPGDREEADVGAGRVDRAHHRVALDRPRALAARIEGRDVDHRDGRVHGSPSGLGQAEAGRASGDHHRPAREPPGHRSCSARRVNSSASCSTWSAWARARRSPRSASPATTASKSSRCSATSFMEASRPAWSSGSR